MDCRSSSLSCNRHGSLGWLAHPAEPANVWRSSLQELPRRSVLDTPSAFRVDLRLDGVQGAPGTYDGISSVTCCDVPLRARQKPSKATATARTTTKAKTFVTVNDAVANDNLPDLKQTECRPADASHNAVGFPATPKVEQAIGARDKRHCRSERQFGQRRQAGCNADTHSARDEEEVPRWATGKESIDDTLDTTVFRQPENSRSLAAIEGHPLPTTPPSGSVTVHASGDLKRSERQAPPRPAARARRPSQIHLPRGVQVGGPPSISFRIAPALTTPEMTSTVHGASIHNCMDAPCSPRRLKRSYHHADLRCVSRRGHRVGCGWSTARPSVLWHVRSSGVRLGVPE